VAANGDNIDSTFVSSPDFSTQSLGYITVTEIHAITGGTGRFAGAQGNFVLERTHIAALSADGTHVTFGSFHGTIPPRAQLTENGYIDSDRVRREAGVTDGNLLPGWRSIIPWPSQPAESFSSSLQVIAVVCGTQSGPLHHGRLAASFGFIDELAQSVDPSGGMTAPICGWRNG
jgi:hypothetical protein